MHLFPPGMFKLLVLGASAVCIAIGWSTSESTFANIGAGLFIGLEVFELIGIYVQAKACTLDELEEHGPVSSRISIISRWIHAAMWFAGMVGFVVFAERDPAQLLASAVILFIGHIVIYFMYGLVLKFTVGLPVRMGYGGWAVRQRRKRR